MKKIYIVFLILPLAISFAYKEEYKIMEENLSEFEKCYQEILIKNNDLNVRIDMEFEIINNGRVGHAISKLNSKNKINTPPNQVKEIEKCFVSTVKKLQFPKLSEYETKRIKYNFILENIGEVYESCEHENNTFKCVKYLRVDDHGFIRFTIPMIHDFFGKDISVRLPEILIPSEKSKVRCEVKAHRKYKQFINHKLSNASRIDLNNTVRGDSFNLISEVFVEGQSLKQLLIEGKLTVDANSSAKKGFDWCLFSK